MRMHQYESQSVSNQPTLLLFEINLLFFQVITLQYDTFGSMVFQHHQPTFLYNLYIRLGTTLLESIFKLSYIRKHLKKRFQCSIISILMHLRM